MDGERVKAGKKRPEGFHYHEEEEGEEDWSGLKNAKYGFHGEY